MNRTHWAPKTFRAFCSTVAGGWVLALLSLGAVSIFVGCSGETRTRVMHFFFEYPAPAPAPAVAVAPSASTRPRGTTGESEVPAGPTARWASKHPPFVKRQCDNCHTRQAGQAPKADFVAACKQCHEPFFAYHRFGHAPVVSGECRHCHVMHVSGQVGLLKAPQAALCTGCHPGQQDDGALDTYHKGIEAVRCTACHDPHFADNQLLLKPEETRENARKQTGQDLAEDSGT